MGTGYQNAVENEKKSEAMKKVIAAVESADAIGTDDGDDAEAKLKQ
jgi:hypothetical protein